MDYVTLRNVPANFRDELRQFGRVLAGYPMKPRELDQKTRLLTIPDEKPTCPLCGDGGLVKRRQTRDGFYCARNHYPVRFGMLRLS